MEWTQEKKAKACTIILDRISEGESVNKILPVIGREEGLPGRRVFYEWLLGDEKLAHNYARACEDRADHIAEEALDIADEREDDVTVLQDGREIVNHNVINRDRLRVDTRKWFAGQLHPKKYGNRTILDGSVNTGITLSIVKEEEDV